MKKTSRGLKIYTDIKDSYGANVWVQDSSSAIKDCCWIYIEGGSIKDNNAATHLTVAQAKRIIKGLEKFVNQFN